MKTMRHFVVMAIVMALAGCATTFRPWNLSQIQEGMEREQVVQILGQPDSSEIEDGSELLRYTYQENYNPSSASVPFYGDNPDLAFEDLENGRRFRQYEYVVILVNGKVAGYKEL